MLGDHRRRAFVIVLSGLSIWKPVQFQELDRAVRRLRRRALRAFLRDGGDRRRSSSSTSSMALLVPKSLRAMITGTLGDMPRIRKIIPGVDPKLLIKDAAKLMPDPARRAVPARRPEPRRAHVAHRLRHHRQRRRPKACCARCRASTTARRPGCSIRTRSRRNYPESAITRAVPVQRLLRRGRGAGGRRQRLQARGRRPGRQTRSRGRSTELYALPQVSQITRHICVEGWSAIGKWSGVRFSRLPQAHRRRHRAPSTSGSSAPRTITTPSTWRPRCIRRPSSRFKFDDQILPRKYGFPMKCASRPSSASRTRSTSWRCTCTNNDPGGYWEDQGYNWFSGL